MCIQASFNGYYNSKNTKSSLHNKDLFQWCLFFRAINNDLKYLFTVEVERQIHHHHDHDQIQLSVENSK